MPEDSRPRILRRFLGGEPLPQDPDVMARVNCLVKLDSALVSLFPHNPVLANLWVTTPSPQFAGCSPLELMLEEGLTAMEELLRRLVGSGDAW